MLALLTAVARRDFGDRVARPGVGWLSMEADGSLRGPDGAPVARDDARPEVAWGTSDLFRDGAPLRPFLQLLADSPSLRWYQSPAAGYDAPVFARLVGNGVRVCNAHVNSLPIAEFVLRAVLDEFQGAAGWRDLQAAHRWAIHDWREVAGSTWVVVGLGGIGRAVATRARALGATVVGCRRTPGPDDPTDRTVTPDRLGDAVASADVLVLAAPAGPSTDGLVDDGLLARLPAGCVLVNVARGSLVDESALLRGLALGRPAVAVLDVFATEPLPDDHPFWDHPSVRVTPHNAAGGVGRLARQADLFADNLDRYLTGRPLLEDVTAAIAAGG